MIFRFSRFCGLVLELFQEIALNVSPAQRSTICEVVMLNIVTVLQAVHEYKKETTDSFVFREA